MHAANILSLWHIKPLKGGPLFSVCAWVYVAFVSCDIYDSFKWSMPTTTTRTTAAATDPTSVSDVTSVAERRVEERRDSPSSLPACLWHLKASAPRAGFSFPHLYLSLSQSPSLSFFLLFVSLLLLFLWWELKRGKPQKNGGLRLQAAATWMNCADSLKCSRVRYNIPTHPSPQSTPYPAHNEYAVWYIVERLSGIKSRKRVLQETLKFENLLAVPFRWFLAKKES